MLMHEPRPGVISVIKRDGQIVDFDRDRIRMAVLKAYMNPAVLGEGGRLSSAAHVSSIAIATDIERLLHRRQPSGGMISIEEIQDQVELNLMRRGLQQVAREYILYREGRKQARLERRAVPREGKHNRAIQCVMTDGRTAEVLFSQIHSELNLVAEGIPHVDTNEIMNRVMRSCFDGMRYQDLMQQCLMETRTLIETEPHYSFVASGILLSELRKEVAHTLGIEQFSYAAAFQRGIEHGVKVERLSPELLEFDLPLLAAAIQPERDKQFRLLGMQTVYDRYLLHSEGHRFEMPQSFLMRVAMGVALREVERNAKAIEFYELLSSFDYMSSTPTLFNAGTLHSQLSSCYLTSVPDNLLGIYGALQDNAMLSKWAGGLGNDWTNVRALGSYIKGTNGRSQGVVPFLKVANDTAVAVNQGGKRNGAVCAYLETWHLDIEEFLELRKNTGDDRRRTHDMNTANWVPDLFMKRVFAEDKWTLFTPSETPDLHDLTGIAFQRRYEEYEKLAAEGKIKHFKTVQANDLWKKMLGMLFETGHPWITFKDACNLRSPQQHAGVVHCSNLCTEITLNTKANEEIAVCNLGSVNLAAHIDDKGGINHDKLRATVRTAVRMLDNVIDINFYAVSAARTANERHRPVGLGIMGFQDALYKMNVPYGSPEAVAFADRSMEAVSYFAIEASVDLAVERGAYSSFEGSLWSQGVLPIDSLDLLAAARGADFLVVDRSSTMDWAALRERVKGGMRNSNVMAIAPTATIANIVGVSQSIEPSYENLYVKSNLSGEFTVINEQLVERLREQGLWDAVMINDLKFHDGSLSNIPRIDEQTKRLFETAFQIAPKWILECASRRQKWIDQAQSLNLYVAEANGKKIDALYKNAWLMGLKTTYYLRAKAATAVEKSTVTTGALNAVSNMMASDFSTAAPVPKACSLENPDCEACQ